ncbi:Hypothetical protein IALB_1772 [Ignavibacterium album JCM 16511]|uniref:Uncharacterized protein n=1 Tax=Ignavibacterium album (strain DSM 19864 / JCM 16511 / NBRC 101810 / Mat9-16) TaxID=945713 RepID=I0AKH2_IGNAJ|nr:hypothetical protein [Ignavibacterium album]AFH49479.1 Hypothetical protein IALB_1772 [Ignavibacterium album JCM 16511]
MKKNYKRKKVQQEKFDTFILKDWDENQELEEEELEDLMEEFNIPEIDYIEPTDKPEELTFN